MAIATHDFRFLRELVADHSGNVITPRHAGMLERRLLPLVGTSGTRDVRTLVQRLRDTNDATLSKQVAQAVMVNETSFFRDPGFFETLRTTILPELIRRNARRREIRIWSAACSSGQEPLSIAMLIREHFPNLADWNIRIVASDISEAMLQRVLAARYSQLEVSRGLNPHRLVRFFDRSGNAWKAKQELCEMIEVHPVNLVQRWPYLGQFDIALLRNVLIYFNSETKTDILKRARGALRPEGYLFVGAAETLIGLRVPYQRKQIDATVSYRPTAV